MVVRRLEPEIREDREWAKASSIDEEEIAAPEEEAKPEPPDPYALLDLAVERRVIKPLDRQIFLLRGKGKTYTEIGKIVGLSWNAVELRLRHARKALAESPLVNFDEF